MDPIVVVTYLVCHFLPLEGASQAAKEPPFQCREYTERLETKRPDRMNLGKEITCHKFVGSLDNHLNRSFFFQWVQDHIKDSDDLKKRNMSDPRQVTHLRRAVQFKCHVENQS
jgi:hypothetical protein